jgi:hypothetical protein
LKPGSPKYEVGVLTTWLQHSIKIFWCCLFLLKFLCFKICLCVFGAGIGNVIFYYMNGIKTYRVVHCDFQCSVWNLKIKEW